MMELPEPERISYLDALTARSREAPQPDAWDAWGEPHPRSHLMCICGRAEVRPGEALCSRCDGPE